MNQRGTDGGRPTLEGRGLATDRLGGAPRLAPDAPTPPRQSRTNPAIWTYRRDRFGFTSDSANGWETSYGFTTLEELVQALADHGHAERRINKLGICAHGDVGGTVQISAATDLTPDNVDYPDIRSRLDRLATFLTTDAQIIFFSCIAGQGERGSQLLQRLSSVWPHRVVIGFATFGYIDTSFSARNAPGNIYDTEQTQHLFAEQAASEARAGTRRLPRMNESSPNAKWARNGHVIRTPATETVR